MKWIERYRERFPLKRFALFGMAGSIVVLACILVPMAAYAGRAGERFSPLNHFISELGEAGVSRLAPVFNAGLVAAGVLYVPFVLGLGAAVGGWWAAAGTLAGLVSAVSVACVGFFPMNNLAPHIAAAMTFFRSGLVTVLLFGVAIQLQRADRRVIDRRANLAGIAALAWGLAWGYRRVPLASPPVTVQPFPWWGWLGLVGGGPDGSGWAAARHEGCRRPCHLRRQERPFHLW